MLAAHGYGVLLFDRRGEGDSEGDGNVFGWGGEKDILAAIDFLHDRPDVDPARVGGLGLSVGGELMLQTASTSEDLAAVVSEGAGTRTFAEEREELPGPRNWFDYPLYAVKTGALAILSNTMPPPKLTDLVAADRTASCAPDLGTQRRQRRDDEPHLPPPRRRQRVDLGDAARRPHRWDQGRARRVRTTSRGLLRRGPSRPRSALRRSSRAIKG